MGGEAANDNPVGPGSRWQAAREYLVLVPFLSFGYVVAGWAVLGQDLDGELVGKAILTSLTSAGFFVWYSRRDHEAHGDA